MAMLGTSSTLTRSESKTKSKVEFESIVPELPPPSYKEATAQGWRNLRLKVKTAREFSAQLATKEQGWYSRND